MRHKCYLALGGNLANPRRNIIGAKQYLRRILTINLQKESNLYLTSPIGIKVQPNYWNCVIEITTRLTPAMLLKQCQNIEKKYQRQRKQHWGARTLDIDILTYGNLKIKTPNLTLPHPEMNKRDFVLMPLLEIAPEFKVVIGENNLKRTIIKGYARNNFCS